MGRDAFVNAAAFSGFRWDAFVVLGRDIFVSIGGDGTHLAAKTNAEEHGLPASRRLTLSISSWHANLPELGLHPTWHNDNFDVELDIASRRRCHDSVATLRRFLFTFGWFLVAP